MKFLLTTVALAIASPAVAQFAPADLHAGHTAAASQAPQAGHATNGAVGAEMDHSQHKGCCDKQSAGKAMPCCEKVGASGKKMACCDKTASAKPSDPHAGHDVTKGDPHAGHNIGQQ